jgi:hypothetical protein
MWGTIVNNESWANETIIPEVPPPSHKVIARQNIVVHWILRITKVSIENNGMSNTIMWPPQQSV